MTGKREELLSVFDEKLDPWRWEPPPPPLRKHGRVVRNSFDGCFLNDRDWDGAFDIQTKRAVLHVCPAVVCLVSYHG